MKTLITKFASRVIEMRLVVLSIGAVFLGLALYHGRGIPFESSFEYFFLQDDPNLAAFNKLVDLYGDTEYLMVGVSAREQDRDVFEPETLRVISAITSFLEEHRTVTQTRSLTSYEYTHSEGGLLSSDPLIEDVDELAADPDKIQSAREIVAQEQLAIGTLITPDLRHTRIVARVEYNAKNSVPKVVLVGELLRFVGEQGFAARGYQIRYGGGPFMEASLAWRNQASAQVINPVMVLVMIAVLLFTFRTISGAVLPCLAIALGVIYLTGVKGVLGFPTTMVNQVLTPTMIIIGVSVTVHVLVEFFHFRQGGFEAKAAAKRTISRLWVPMFFTAFGTAACFAATAVTEMVPIREFAYLGAIGVLVMFVLSLTVLPALLSYVKKISGRTHAQLERGFVVRFTQALPGFTLRHRNTILWLGGSLLLFVLLSVPTIRVDTDVLAYFKKNDPARADILYFDEVYENSLNIQLIVDAGANGGVKQPAFLARVESLQNYLDGLDTTAKIISLVDYLKKINQSLNDGDPAYYRLPTTAEQVAQFLLLYDNSGPAEDLTDIKDFDDRYLRLSVPMRYMTSSKAAEELDAIQSTIDTQYSDLDILVTGPEKMSISQRNYINTGMFLSFSAALLVIGGCLIVSFRSLKYGCIAMIPAVLPFLIVAGVIGLAGIPFNITTSITGAMIMGLSVDEAIHVLSRYLLAKKEGASTHEAIRRTMTETGPAVVMSSLVLMLGFGVMLFGAIMPIVYTGLYGAAIILLALSAVLFLLPAILYLVDGAKETVRGGVMRGVTGRAVLRSRE